jgi:signal transduction histidine kinase
MLISLFFSIGIYSKINEEFSRFENFQIRLKDDINEKNIVLPPGPRPNQFVRLDSQEIQAARIRLISTLAFINFVIFVLAGAAGYFLAGRTLKPIKKMMDEQNRFITDSSHELRTPLTSLKTEIEVGLRNKKLNQKIARKILESNLEEVINLEMLSNNLLELAQNGNFINKNALKTVSLSEILKKAVNKTQKIADTKQIKVINNIKDTKITGVEDRLVEVFIILLDNSIKYSLNKGNIELISKIKEDKVLVSVIDNGMGISREDLPHIFDRFYRADKSRTKKGYGLGLSIAKKIIESHKGSIVADSTPNKQTTFTVTLPV